MKKFFAAILIILLCSSYVCAEQKTYSYSIQINTASQTLRLFSNEILIKEYPVAVGKPATKTPLGTYTIRNKVVNPWWKGVAPGPKNPLGIRWLGISTPRGSYGIHGNNVPSSIGTYASGGCVRMFNNDVEELYSKLTVSTPVQIIYENVELKQDTYSNSAVLIVYPDVYKQKKAETLIKKLTADNGLITQEQVETALKLAAGNLTNPVAVCNGTAIMLNNKYITNDAFVEGDQIYMYFMSAAEHLGIDGDMITDYSIPVLERDNKTYINLTRAALQMGAKLRTDSANRNVYLGISLVRVNGKFLCSYEGSFDKEYLINAGFINQIGSYVDSGSKKSVSLKELCKQQNWLLTVNSLNKVINIDIPLSLKVADSYIGTVPYNGRYYIDSSDAGKINDIQNQSLNIYSYQNKDYYDVNELMERYEVQQDRFHTVIEVFKPLNSGV